MNQITFSDHWQAFFEPLGFCRFEDFFDAFEGSQINKNTKRSVLVRTFEQGPETHTFFLKRFFNPHLKDMLFAMYNWRQPCSQGRLEWNCAHHLLSHGIHTYQPVCFGEVSIMGIERRSFFLTEKLTGTCLMDFLQQRWKSLTPRQQEKVLLDLARFIQRIHRLHVSLPDLYVYHLFIENPADEQMPYTFAVIDLHRMSIRIPDWRMPPCRIENLARLNFSLRDEYISPSQRVGLLRESLSDLPPSKTDGMIQKIIRRSTRIAQYRKLPAY
jgi:hypothetical protein